VMYTEPKEQLFYGKVEKPEPWSSQSGFL